MFVHQTFSSSNSEGSGRANAIASSMVKEGYQVSIIAGANSYLTGEVPQEYRGKWITVETCDGYTVYRPWTYSKLHKSFLHRAMYFLVYMLTAGWALLRMPRFSVIVGCSPPITVAVVAYVGAVLRRKPFIFEVRDLWPAFPIQMGVIKNRLVIWLSQVVETLLYRRSDLVVINSPGFIPYLHEHGVEGQKLRLIPNGVDVATFSPQPKDQELWTRLGLQDKFVVLYIGAHGPANSLHRLLDVATLLLGDTRIQFLLIGDGKEKAALEDRAGASALSNVTFLSPQPKGEIPRYIGSADLCYASLQDIPMFTTTYPNKVFDYLACGKAILTTIDGVSRDVIEQAQAGLYVSHSDAAGIAAALRWCASHPDELHKMGMRGRAHAVAKWDRLQFADAFSNVVGELC